MSGRYVIGEKPELTAGWKLAYAKGVAGAICDRIVHNRPIPPRLITALTRRDRRAA